VSVVQRSGPFDSPTIRRLLAMADMIEACGATNIPEETVLDWMEEGLRARMAVPVEPSISERR